jgi:serine/threonine-protein kinase
VTWYDQPTVAEAPDGARPRFQGRIGAVIKDKWRIDARLGSGGMATVYAATHRNGNRVAIKMLHPDFSRDPAVRSRFLREGYVANAVGHPGTVRVLDDDITEDGSVFLVMELLEGESLELRRERLGGRLPVEEVFTVGDQLLDLLNAAHTKGIIHRDIKPENIFVTKEGAVKVLDFGIAQMRHLASERTGTGLMLGTPDFMSPEQAGGNRDEIDARSDLWAVGATMFTLLSGESVHRAETLRDYLIALSTTPARTLASAAAVGATAARGGGRSRARAPEGPTLARRAGDAGRAPLGLQSGLPGGGTPGQRERHRAPGRASLVRTTGRARPPRRPHHG